MLNSEDFVSESIEDNLFYLRTLREYCANIQLSLTKDNNDYINTAEDFAKRYEKLGRRILKYANGNVSKKALDDEIFVTEYTLQCEELTQKLFNIKIATDLTQQELNLTPGKVTNPSKELIQELDDINKKARTLTQNLIDFCQELLDKLKKQELFSYSYPAIFQFIILEGKTFINNLNRLIDKNEVDPTFVAGYQYLNNNSMMGIAVFIRDLVDPNHIDIFNQANSFVNQFDSLSREYETTQLSPSNQQNLNNKSLQIVSNFKKFISNCIKRLLNKEIYFIIDPIFLDNMYTDVNYFKYILEIDKEEILE